MAIPPEYLFFVFEPKPGVLGGGYERVVWRCFIRQVVVFVAGVQTRFQQLRRVVIHVTRYAMFGGYALEIERIVGTHVVHLLHVRRDASARRVPASPV